MSWGETLVRFVLAVFATWRVTHLLACEDGPGDVVFHLRRWVGDSPLGGLMDCFNCLSFWVAAPAALVVVTRPLAQPLDWVLVWLALCGAACWLERFGRPAEPPPASSEGDPHVLR